MMLIKSISLHNFGAYRGLHEINLTPSSQSEPIVLFGGLNGAGKTTLLDGLQLVLYGKRAQCAGRGNLSYDEYLRRSVNRSVAGREGAALEISFEAPFDGSHSQFRVHRTWETTERDVNEHLAVYCDGGYSRLLTERWDEIIEEIMPLDIASLFFFDGEKIEALADPDRAGLVIGTAIDSLLGLGLLQRLQTDLVALERRKRNVSVNAEAKEQLTALDQEVSQAQSDQADAVQEQAQRRTELDRAETVVANAREQFRQHGGELFNKRSELEKKRDELITQSQDISNQLIDLAGSSLPLRLVPDLIKSVAAQRLKEREAESAEVLIGELKQRDERLLELIGSSLSSDQEEVIKTFFEQEERTHLERTSAPRYLDHLGDIDGRLAFVWPHEIERTAATTAELLSVRATTQAELDEIERMLAAVPESASVSELNQAVQQASETLGQASARYELATEQLEEARRRLEAAESKRERLEKSVNLELEAEEEARRLIEHSNRTRATVKQFRDALIERHLGRIEIAVLESLQRLLRKQRLVHDLRLDPQTFRLTLYDTESNVISPDRMSAGERQLLAVALLWGLARVSGRKLPTVIDTPLGRLDGTHRKLLAERYFPQASHQVLLLSTDEEIDEGLLEIIKPAIAHSYELQYDDASQSTTVSAGYFGDKGVTHVA